MENPTKFLMSLKTTPPINLRGNNIDEKDITFTRFTYTIFRL